MHSRVPRRAALLFIISLWPFASYAQDPPAAHEHHDDSSAPPGWSWVKDANVFFG